MIRRMLLLAGIAIFALAPAAAAQYADDGSLTIDDPNPTPGATVGLNLTGCGPNETVSLTIAQGSNVVDLGTFTADADGNLNADITIPAGFEPGTAVITATCVDAAGDEVTFSLTIQIAGPDAGGGTTATGGSGTLPRTGSDTSLPLAQLAIVLVGVGGLFVLAARRNSSTATA